ncbi:putative Fasciclin-like arabinogalactan protein 20 [Hibiscus syriacus]|uniref:Fasciclin-like arabinogalactan protein 20 n=1 Tax=Hibiscus syriacus TaxID=106335 RepID=A0A6A3C9Q0_HIBSY|nr:putative Fasciclin-like arabinogalactan protein 20 [Hibiscus syriacus]
MFVVNDGGINLGPWKNEISELPQAPSPTIDKSPSTLVLAAQRTNRPDILRHFKHYHGGWNITNRHYWVSVGFTGAAGFIFAALWLISFGLVLLVYHCCRWRTKQILNNVTQYLSLTKTINVADVFLPSDVLTGIDKLNIDLNSSADTLTDKTNDNAGKIRRVFNAVRLALITMAAVMLILALLGLLLSILGHQHAIHIFIVSGWFRAAITFILCGVFVIMNNAISDTCLAMEEWVEHPHAETALSNILPCVDQRTTNHTLNPSPDDDCYYNQSGPSMPPLCSPFDSQLQNRLAKLHLHGISIWATHHHGTITPDRFTQLVAAVNESHALEHYTPLLLCLQNCDFVRDTFRNIASNYCRPLEHYLKIVNAGLELISVGVLLCRVLWIFYVDHLRREEASVK